MEEVAATTDAGGGSVGGRAEEVAAAGGVGERNVSEPTGSGDSKVEDQLTRTNFDVLSA
jgi:hypothetical protein